MYLGAEKTYQEQQKKIAIIIITIHFLFVNLCSLKFSLVHDIHDYNYTRAIPGSAHVHVCDVYAMLIQLIMAVVAVQLGVSYAKPSNTVAPMVVLRLR